MMVLKLNKHLFIFRTLAKDVSVQDKVHGLIICCQKKHLSKMVSARKSLSLWREKLDKFLKWYDEFTGMDEVRQSQRRVLEDEENFRRAQEERRYYVNELNEIKSKLKSLYAELDTTNRSDERYIHLVTQEHRMLKEEKAISEKFELAEKTERELFSALSSSVKLSHEKERAQSERTKYWSIIGSVMGTVIGIFGSSVNNHFKMKELKELIKSSADESLVENLHNYLETNENLITKLRENITTLHSSTVNLNEEFFNKLNSQLDNLNQSLKIMEKTCRPKGESDESHHDNSYTSKIDSLGEAMKTESTRIKMLLFTLAVLSILMPIITKYS